MDNRSNGDQQSPQYFFPSLRYLQNYVWPPQSSETMDFVASQSPAEKDFPQRAMSDPALSEFGKRSKPSLPSSPATYPAFATLLAAANSSGGHSVNDGYRYSLRDSRVASDEREIIPIDKHTGIAGEPSLCDTTDTCVDPWISATLVHRSR